jgi:hypothetical protein
MLDQQSSTLQPQWQKADQVWELFTQLHPELGLRSSRWAFHNFLRPHRDKLVDADALRLARNRFWVANVDRFCAAAFECATGKQPAPAPVSNAPHLTTLRPELPSAFVAAHRVRVHGLTADEYLRLHNNLPPRAIEELLDLNERLLELADAAREFLPALEWYPDSIPSGDMERLARLQRALVRVDHGHV